MPGTAADWGAIGPNVEASLTSLQVSASNGGRHRNAPTGRGRRDARERPVVPAPHAPEPPLRNRHDSLHARARYGDDRNGQSNRRSGRYTNEGERRANRDATGRKRGDAEYATRRHYALRRGCSEMSGHCPQADTSPSGWPWSSGMLGALLSTAAAATDAGATHVHHAARSRAEPVADQLDAVAGEPDRGTLTQEEQQTSILDDKYNTAQQNLQNAQSSLQSIAANLVHTRSAVERRPQARRPPMRWPPTSTERPRPASRPTSRRRPP